MRLYEFESKQVLKDHGVRVPASVLVSSLDGLEDALPLPAMAKVQILAGGRMKKGGIKSVDDDRSAGDAIRNLVGQSFGDDLVEQVLLEQRMAPQREYLIGISYDTSARCPVLLFSSEGGVDIEETAATRPEVVHFLEIDPIKGLNTSQAVSWLTKLRVAGPSVSVLAEIAVNLSRLFISHDLLLLEINPLAQMSDGEFVALDCHMEIDDDALVRSPLANVIDFARRRQGARRMTGLEQKARQIDEGDHRGVSGRMIEFEGNLGLLIGGGGASLTVFDAIRNYGGKPANYCEVGGNPTVERVKALTRLLVSQENVHKIAVIMNVVNNTRADVVAEGVVEGVLEAGFLPGDMIVVFRLPGSGEAACRKLLEEHGVAFQGREVSLDEAAALAVELTQQQSSA